MKKILAIFLLAGVTFALFPQAADNQPKESQPIVVGGTDQGPSSTPVVRTITTKKGYSSTTTVPETVTTVTAPEKVLVREAALSWMSIGLRSAIDYHLTPKEGSLSCLGIYGEFYNRVWGVQLGISYMQMPVLTYTDLLGTTFNGTGTRGNVNLDFLLKFHWLYWDLKWFYWGVGLNYAALLGGQLKWYENTAAAAVANPTNAQTPLFYANWVDITAGGGILYAQGAIGLRLAMGGGFNLVNFEPDFRILYPLNAPTGYGAILRFNLGFSYSFGL